jgi:hypothetical protein
MGRDSVVCIAGRSWNLAPVEARFFVPDQTGDGAYYPPFCTVGTGSLIPGKKRSVHNINHSPPSSAEVKQTVELYLYSRSGLYGKLQGELYFTWLPVKAV